MHLKLNICERPIANKYREGKMKRTLKRELKQCLKSLKEKRFGEVIFGSILSCRSWLSAVVGEMPSGVLWRLSQLLCLRSVLSGKSESVRGAEDRALRR